MAWESGEQSRDDGIKEEIVAKHVAIFPIRINAQEPTQAIQSNGADYAQQSLVRRQMRREKQRLANPVRARKMHIARLESEHLREKWTPNRASSPRLNIGCSGWFYWHWRERFYPRDLPTRDWFRHYAAHFKTVELNAPFYSWPTVANVQTWLRQAGRRKFIYTVKVCELITHVKRFMGTAQLIKDFGFIVDLLGSHAGCMLFQLPPSFKYSAARLKRILQQLEPHRRNVVEFRHKSWWNKTVYRAFEKAGVIFCSCSGPRLPDELIKTADEIYIRFHGTKRWYRHDYSTKELTVWANRIRACKPKRVWAYFNNDRDCNAIRNAKELSRLLGRKRRA